MKKQIILYFVSFLFSASLLSQPCFVNVDSLKGEYKGDCKSGRAEGKGTAKGTDTYTGNFKNGYPDGKGKYTWKNGNWYEGFWKDGLFDGMGTFSRLVNNKPDSIIVMTGFWKKGKYIGKNENPYLVHSITNNITDVSIRKLKNTESEITITVKNITSGASSLSNAALPKTRLINIEIIGGRFEQQVANETSPVTNTYTLRKVTFPFYAIFSFETAGAKLQVEKAVLEIFESANWSIQVSIEN